MTYEDISRVNSEITMLDLKGKDYAMVPERVTAFRKLFPDGFIKTEIISNDGTTVLMKAEVGFYTNNGPIVLATGLAQEVKGKGMVNGTSHVENCETSAVGRALGMLGLGINGGGICSAEELANAVTAQRQMKEEPPATKVAEVPRENGTVKQAAKVPEIPKKEEQNPQMTPVMEYLLKCMADMREMRQITAAENNKLFKAQRNTLVKAKLAPDKSLAEYTMEEALALIDAMYRCFDPTGTELKTE
jgi:hypothetical protein